MSEQVKVFKNANNQTAVGAAHSVTLASTGSTERAVVKEVNCRGVKSATLDLDGRTLATSTTEAVDMVASGNLIMDINSTLALKFPAVAVTPASFEGMFFSNGADSINYILGDGVGSGSSTAMTSIVNNQSNGSHPAHSSFTAIKNGVRTFFRYNSSNVYEYISTSTSAVSSYGFGSGYGACTDGTYMYNIASGGNTTIYRRHIETSVDSNFSASTTVYGQQENQGSFLLHHNGYLYTKQEGGGGTMYIIKISDGSVTTVSNGAVGSYSDGACIVTTVAGTSYVVEQGTSEWAWYEIGGSSTSFTKISGATNGSTEYGQGGVEVAPGIAYIFCEHSDDLSIIDMNPSTPTWEHIPSASTRTAAVHNAFGNTFSICGFITPYSTNAYTYDAYTSGVLITEDA